MQTQYDVEEDFLEGQIGVPAETCTTLPWPQDTSARPHVYESPGWPLANPDFSQSSPAAQGDAHKRVITSRRIWVAVPFQYMSACICTTGCLAKQDALQFQTCLSAQGALIIDPCRPHLTIHCQCHAVHAPSSHLLHLSAQQENASPALPATCVPLPMRCILPAEQRESRPE